MTDRALANAEKRRDEIAARINKMNQEVDELRKQLVGVEEFIAEWHQFAGSPVDSEVSTNTNTAVTGRLSKALLTRAPQSPPRNPDKGVVGQHAKAIIHERGKPVPRTELFAELGRRGIHIYGKDPEMVLSTMMWRMQDEFIRLPKYGYWIRWLPYREANYEPGAAVEPDQEDLDLLTKNILDPGGMADIEPSADRVEITKFNGYLLRPEKREGGWVVHVQPITGNALTRTTMVFSTVEAAIAEAQKVIMGGQPHAASFRRF